MNELSRMTAICADTFNHEMALIACQRMLQHGFAQVVLFTDDAINAHLDKVPAGLQLVRIPPLQGSIAYSEFAIRSMHPHVHTSHALVFQWDGFVIHPECWRTEFLNYDYIGAPWPRRSSYGHRRVGNGGFSLRSVKLMRAAAQLAPMDLCEWNEDSFICFALGEILEREFGLLFAPLDVAKAFSVENGSVAAYCKADPDLAVASTFGFHGAFNFHLAFDDEALLHAYDICLRHPGSKALLHPYHTGNLLVALVRSGRKPVALQLLARVCEAVGLDPATTLRQLLVDHLGFRA